MKPSWQQAVMYFVVIQSCKLDAIQPALTFAGKADCGIASAGSTNVLCKPLLNLRNRDCRHPFFPRWASNIKNYVAISESVI